MKLVHLVGFITKKFVTIHGYMIVKKKISSSLLGKHVAGRATVQVVNCRVLTMESLV